MFQRHLHYANDAETFLKHFSDCLFYFCSTFADSITNTELIYGFVSAEISWTQLSLMDVIYGTGQT